MRHRTSVGFRFAEPMLTAPPTNIDEAIACALPHPRRGRRVHFELGTVFGSGDD